MNRHERRAIAATQRRDGMRYYLDDLTWTRRCIPHLDDPELRRVLHRDFGLFTIHKYGMLKGDLMPGDFAVQNNDWKGQRKPLWWQYQKDLACQFLVNANLRLAMLAEPDRPWRILTSNLHSTVWDGAKTLFDLNYTAGPVSADKAYRAATDTTFGNGYHEQFSVGTYMPLKFAFPDEDNDIWWALWERNVEQSPALRKALFKGLRRGHLATKSNHRRAENLLNEMMARDRAGLPPRVHAHPSDDYDRANSKSERISMTRFMFLMLERHRVVAPTSARPLAATVPAL